METMEPFWDFSVSTYGKPGVADACLALQDRHGLDVNVLLFCCWFGRARGVVDEPLWDRVLAFSEAWAGNVVRPLRAARTWMKHTDRTQYGLSNDECMKLREEVKRVELKAEQLQERALEELAGDAVPKILDSTSQIVCTSMNLKEYLRHCGVELDAASRSGLAHIVTAAIGGATLDAAGNSINATFQGS